MASAGWGQTGAFPAESREQRAAADPLTPDSRFVIFSLFPPKAEIDKAKKEKKKPQEMPKNGMVILDLTSGSGLA